MYTSRIVSKPGAVIECRAIDIPDHIKLAIATNLERAEKQQDSKMPEQELSVRQTLIAAGFTLSGFILFFGGAWFGSYVALNATSDRETIIRIRYDPEMPQPAFWTIKGTGNTTRADYRTKDDYDRAVRETLEVLQQR